MDILLKYFPALSDVQRGQFARLEVLYQEWNAKINVISRKDIDALYERHVLHSLGIARHIRFKPNTRVLDVGTGGGFPGLPLAIMFPQCRFTLIDSIGKKLKVAADVAAQIGLKNVTFIHENVKEERGKFDFIVSRAVMQAAELVRLTQKNVAKEQHNALPNGIICLKGGDLADEMAELHRYSVCTELRDYFDEPFFETKKILYIPIK